MAELPKWIAPGDAATLLWYSGKGESPDGVPVEGFADRKAARPSSRSNCPFSR